MKEMLLSNKSNAEIYKTLNTILTYVEGYFCVKQVRKYIIYIFEIIYPYKGKHLLKRGLHSFLGPQLAPGPVRPKTCMK